MDSLLRGVEIFLLGNRDRGGNHTSGRKTSGRAATDIMAARNVDKNDTLGNGS